MDYTFLLHKNKPHIRFTHMKLIYMREDCVVYRIWTEWFIVIPMHPWSWLKTKVQVSKKKKQNKTKNKKTKVQETETFNDLDKWRLPLQAGRHNSFPFSKSGATDVGFAY